MRSRTNASVMGFSLFRCTLLGLVVFLFVGVTQARLFGNDGVDGLASANADASSEALVQRIRLHLKAGEFKVAKELAERLDEENRDTALIEVARFEKAEGLFENAVRTAMSVSPEARKDGIRALVEPMRLSQGPPSEYDDAQNTGQATVAGDSEDRRGYRAGDQDAGNGGDGGAAIADFDSLMELIRNTVAPDTWDSVGGPSTMSAYRAGIHVDLDGMVREIEVLDASAAGAMRSSLLRSGHRGGDASPRGQNHGDWTAPSTLRVVSLGRLAQAWAVRRACELPPTLAMENLAGLTEIQYLAIDGDDLLIAGTVGGIDATAVPWPRDSTSGQVPLGLDILAASARCVSGGISYGCSIDPTPQGLANVGQARNSILDGSVPLALRAERLAEAMGPQAITLIGVRHDSPLAWLMVETDRHMKQLALGVHEMPEGVRNYLDVVSSRVRQGDEEAGEAGALLRMWFAPEPKTVRRALESQTYELQGRPIRLVTAKELADLQGERSQAGEDTLGREFAKQFNDNFGSIASRYPGYDRLRGAFELTAMLQLVRNEVGADRFNVMTEILRSESELAYWHLRVPKMCDTLAVRHGVTSHRKRHEFYFASGGIDVDPSTSLVTKIESYPPLDDYRDPLTARPSVAQWWWWDVQTGGR